MIKYAKLKKTNPVEGTYQFSVVDIPNAKKGDKAPQWYVADEVGGVVGVSKFFADLGFSKVERRRRNNERYYIVFN